MGGINNMKLKPRLNENGSIDTYIATVLCITMLLIFMGFSTLLVKAFSDYSSLQRIMDEAVDGIKTYGGYTAITHSSMQKYLDGRSIDKSAITLTAKRNDGSDLDAKPYVYGQDVKLTLIYKYHAKFWNFDKTFNIPVESTGISQFVEGVVPNQCYINTSGGVTLQSTPSCTNWVTPSGGTPNDDFFWK